MLQKLIGRKITECWEEETGFAMKLDNGEEIRVTVSLEGGPGLDSEWHQWGVLRLNGKQVGKRA